MQQRSQHCWRLGEFRFKRKFNRSPRLSESWPRAFAFMASTTKDSSVGKGLNNSKDKRFWARERHVWNAQRSPWKFFFLQSQSKGGMDDENSFVVVVSLKLSLSMDCIEFQSVSARGTLTRFLWCLFEFTMVVTEECQLPVLFLAIKVEVETRISMSCSVHHAKSFFCEFANKSS